METITFLGPISMNANGNRIALTYTSNNITPGTVQVYDWNGASWSQVGSSIPYAAYTSRVIFNCY